MPFSSKQCIVLSKLCNEAYYFQEELDLIDLPADLRGESKTTKLEFFRRRELNHAVGKTSFKDCHAAKDYLRVKTHFLKLCGRDDYETTRQKDEWGSDATHTSACSALRQLQTAAQNAGFSDAYISKIAFNRFGEEDLRQLTEQQIWQLFYTIQNRSNAKLGIGTPELRNKKQRAASKKS